MSLTNDAVTVFKNTLLSVIHKQDAKSLSSPLLEQTSPSTAPTLMDQSLLAVARDTASIRHTHEAILNKAASLGSLQDDLMQVFDRAYNALEQLAEARSQIAKAEAVARFERDARESASHRLVSMTASYHQTVSELEKLRPEAARLEASLRQTTEKLFHQENENSVLDERLNQARAEIERRRAEENAMRRDLEAAKEDLAAANTYITQKTAENVALKERWEIAEQGLRVGAKALEESRSQCADAIMRLDEERVNLASAQSRIAAQETQLKDLGDKFNTAGAVWRHETEKLNETISRLKDELGQAWGRNEAHQRLLSGAQSDLIALRAQCVELEGQLAEARLAAAQNLARAENAEAAREQLTGDLATSKRLHHSLLRRVKPMITTLREKHAECVKLTSTLTEFERRFLTYQSEAGEQIRALQDRETRLVADLETERARRVVAEGSLAMDRDLHAVKPRRHNEESEPEPVRSLAIGARHRPQLED